VLNERLGGGAARALVARGARRGDAVGVGAGCAVGVERGRERDGGGCILVRRLMPNHIHLIALAERDDWFSCAALTAAIPRC
jgi:hypothetical protein